MSYRSASASTLSCILGASVLLLLLVIFSDEIGIYRRHRNSTLSTFSSSKGGGDWLDKLEAIYKNDSLTVYRNKKASTSLNSSSKVGTGRRIVATYASHGIYELKAVNACRSAMAFPNIDACLIFRPSFLDDLFKKQHDSVLKCQHGAGYWLWKPYIVLRLLLEMDPDDVLLYTDADKRLINDLEEFISVMVSVEQDVALFTTFGIVDWRAVKADAFLILNLENVPRVNETMQIYAAYLLLRKSLDSIRFISEWLIFCQDSRVNTDQANLFRQNPRHFLISLHDQATLSLLSKRWQIPGWCSPERTWKTINVERGYDGKDVIPYVGISTKKNFTVPTKLLIEKN